MSDKPKAHHQFMTNSRPLPPPTNNWRLPAASNGPLDDKTRQLVKLALAIGLGHEGAVHAHTLESGITPAEIKHIVTLAVTTLGMPIRSRIRG